MTEQVVVRPTTRPATVLVVEDDPHVQSLLSDVLTAAGHTPVIARTGSQAMETLERQCVDLVLLDLMLPDMSGFDICAHLRHGTGPQIPVMMLTAITQPQNAVKGLQSGADDYLVKPFYADELLLRVEKLLRRRAESIALSTENGALLNMLDLKRRELESAQVESQTEQLLRRELLHNVTVHLQSLSAIVDAELRRLPPGIEREAVQRLRGRVRGAALVYQVSEALQADPVQIGDVITMTASALKSIYRPWKRITLKIDGEPLDLPVAIASPLAMIVNELVTNCFKHAFPENRYGTITISYGLADEMFRLVIGDDGVGINPAAGKGGNGRRTVEQLVANLNGTIATDSGTDGTRTAIEIPVADTATDA